MAVVPPKDMTSELETFLNIALKEDERTRKVLMTIFQVPSAKSLPGEVAWTDFNYSMRGIGFSIKRLQGSAWKFTPDMLKVRGNHAIQFHGPYQRKHFLIEIARNLGSRLTKTYSLNWGSFLW
jgi:hypothetical protein